MHGAAILSCSGWHFAIWVSKAIFVPQGVGGFRSSFVQPPVPICRAFGATFGSHYMRFIRQFLFGSAAVSLIALAPANSQTVKDDTVPEASLEVPGGKLLYKRNDPNVRRATAVVNGEVITGTDIDQRIMLLTNGDVNQVPAEQRDQLRIEILGQLVDESLRIQAAESDKLEVKDSEINDYIKRVADQTFKRSVPETEKYLTQIGSNIGSLRKQVKAELSWNRVLGRNVTPFINVSDDEVNAVMKRLEASKGTVEYRVGEIYLSANDQNREQVYDTARKVIEQLRQGASFPDLSRQMSEASTASQGGDLGWVKLAQLPQAIGNAVVEMNQGEIVAVPTANGISILLLIDKRQIGLSDPRDAALSLKQIALSFPKGSTEAQAGPAVKRFAEETQKIKGCGAADDVARTLGAEVVNRDGLRLGDLPAPLQEVLLKMSVGQSTPPYGSLEDGVRVFVLCGRDAPKQAAEKSPDQIREEIENERIEKRAQLFMRSLRRDAIIEYN
jgi:peptidyl-prolyl cis-trans isomerase SurA